MAEQKTVKPPLTRARRIRLSLLSGSLFVIIIGAILWSHQENVASSLVPTPIPQPAKGKIAADIFRYQGKNGADALTLLKQQTTVEQNNSGLVTSINNRRADSSKHEYWSFFVNGKMAEVGPAAYMTKDGDLIEWKIETY